MTIRNNRGSFVHLAIGIASLIITGLLFGAGGPAAIIGALLFILGAPILLWRWLDRRPQLLLGETYITGRRLRGAAIPWLHIRAVSLKRTAGLPLLVLEVAAADQDSSRFGPRYTTKASTASDQPSFMVYAPIDGLESAPEHIKQLICERLSV